MAHTQPVPASGDKSPAAETDSTPSSRPSTTATKDLIQVSLRSVVLKLPETLKGKTKQPPAGGVRISIPATKILPQLSQGTIRITFGELRKASPPGVFVDASDRDHTLVELPLQEILQQLKPEQLSRRMRQKRVEIPDEVVPIFSQQRGQSGVRIAKPPAPEPPRSRPEPHVAAPPLRPTPIPGPSTSSRPGPLPMPSALRIPSAPPLHPLPIKPATPLAALGSSSQAPAASRPIATAPAPKPASLHTPSSPPRTVAPAPAPIPATSAAVEFISVPLATVTNGWPEPIRQALAGLNAPDATLNLPAGETEQALKRGKVVFPWKRLKPLVRPPLKTALAPSLDDVPLELPLPAIAPLFMAQRKTVSTQRKYDVGEDIPDVFSARGLATAHVPPSPHAHAPAPPPGAQPKVVPPISMPAKPPAPAPIPMATPMAAPAAAPIPALAPAAAPASAPALTSPAPVTPEPRDIGEVFGQPGRKNWSPAEIAQRTVTLGGVAGAVIAMQDGLLVAGQLPPGLNGETIAAFVPQMYSRMMQYSKELNFGETDNITFVIDNVPLRIYRAGSLYFAALGLAHETLPEKPLRLIASHLGPQSK